MQYEIDLHCHTVASGHAYSTITEYATEASAKGLKLIAVTDHAPEMPGGAPLFYFMNLHSVPEFLHGVKILKGAELNILDITGRVDLENDVLRRLDICIASIHPPCFPYSAEKDVTKAILNAMENPYIDVIGHPGDPRFPFDIDAVTAKAKETGTLLEINNSSLNPRGFRAGGNDIIKDIARKCKALSIPVIMGSDAHFHTHIGDLHNSVSLLRDCGMPETLIANNIDVLQNTLKKKRREG